VRFVGGWERLYPVGIPANMVFGLALGVAIVRYRLVEITVLMRRAVLYTLSSVALAPFLILAIHAVARAGRGDGTGSFGAALLAAGALVAGLPLLRRLEGLLERVMFHREHGVRNALLQLARGLGDVTDVAGVARVLARGLVNEIPLRSAGLYLPDAPGDRFWGASATWPPARTSSRCRRPCIPRCSRGWRRGSACSSPTTSCCTRRPTPR
jgi:hypothetical protein